MIEYNKGENDSVSCDSYTQKKTFHIYNFLQL